MKTKRLEKYRRRLRSRMPLIGGWRRHKSIEALMKDGSPGAIRALAEAVNLSNEGQAQDEMMAALQQLTDQRGIDAVCEVWASTRHAELAQLMMKCGWVASEPVKVRALSGLKAERTKVVTEGGAEVVEPLLQACEDGDPDIAERARLSLRQLQKVEARETLCRVVIEHDLPTAREAVLDAQYAPHEMHERALFYFLTAQWDKYENLDFDYSLLRAVYEAADEKMRRRIGEKARRADRVEWVEVAAGGRQGRRLGEMTDREWEVTLEVLSRSGRWAEMWRRAQEAPARWSAQLLQWVSSAEWVPEGDAERAGYEELALLAGKWTEAWLGSLVRCRAALKGHTDVVTCLAISPDGRMLASGSADNTVRLWGLDPFSRLPIGQTSLEDLAWVQETLRDGNLPAEERNCLEFIAALMSWRRRFDIIPDETPQRIAVGEFDIEVE